MTYVGNECYVFQFYLVWSINSTTEHLDTFLYLCSLRICVSASMSSESEILHTHGHTRILLFTFQSATQWRLQSLKRGTLVVPQDANRWNVDGRRNENMILINKCLSFTESNFSVLLKKEGGLGMGGGGESHLCNHRKSHASFLFIYSGQLTWL